MEPIMTAISTNIKSVLDKQNLLLLSILILLLAGIPFFFHFTPYIDTIDNGINVWDYPPSGDKLYFHRLSIIYLGLKLTIIALM
jgi:hypothetical protein